MAKKRTSLKGLGARYGIKLRKSYSLVHHVMKAKRKCPECGSPYLVEKETKKDGKFLKCPEKGCKYKIKL